ncbi:MAG: acetate--CoA ligase family protein [Candidatus Heimdallarchaeota archaeon]
MAETQRVITQAIQQGRKVLTIKESKVILVYEGFPINPTGFGKTLEEILTEAKRIGFPLVLKVSSPDIVHKSDVGGVITGIMDVLDLQEKFEGLEETLRQKAPSAHIEGYVLEKMETGIELLVGSAQDPMFGSILSFGLGGIFVEVFKDVVFRLIPITPEDAVEMLSEIKAAPLLDGVRGQPPVDKQALVELLLQTSRFIESHPEIEELDLNPVFATAKGVSVVDARIILKLAQ